MSLYIVKVTPRYNNPTKLFSYIEDYWRAIFITNSVCQALKMSEANALACKASLDVGWFGEKFFTELVPCGN